MRASSLPSTLCTCAFFLIATSCVFAQSSSTSSTTSSSSSSSTQSHHDPNAISTSSGLSNGAIAGLSAIGGFVFVFGIAATLYIWNRRALRNARVVPDVQELVLSDGTVSGDEEAGGVRRAMAGPLSTTGASMRASNSSGKPLVTPPAAVYRKNSAGDDDDDAVLGKKTSDVSELAAAVSRAHELQASWDWAEMQAGDEEAILQAEVARVWSGKS